MKNLKILIDKILNGHALNYEEALELLYHAPLEELCAAADQVRIRTMGNRFDTCSIMNARSGRCTEDCKWCSQSAHHTSTVDIYPLTDTEEALRHAGDNHAKGIGRFSLVTSGRTMTDREIEKSASIYLEIARRYPDLKLCASMGLLTLPQLRRLNTAGVERYHCNIETAPSYFPTLCTTHTVEEKLRTIGWAREAGMAVCSGGIVGMGETAEQRVEMALTLRDVVQADSIPINVLNPIPGTRLEGTPPLADGELLRTFALFRLINPRAYIRFAGGRTLLSLELQERALRSGVNAAIMGDLLTTIGSSVEEDRALFNRCGFSL